MVSRFAIALIFLGLGLSLISFGLISSENKITGSLTRFSAIADTTQIYYTSVFTTPVAVVATPTPLPPTPAPTPTPVPKTVSSSGSGGSPIFLIFLVIIFGGIVLAVVASTIRVGRRR